MEAIDTELSTIHEQLQQLDKDIGFPADRRGFRRGPIVVRGNGVDRRSRDDGIENYGYNRENLKRRREPEDEEEEEIERKSKRTVMSTVVMPSIETKSRDEKLQEMAKTENKDVVKRNKRMFSNLMGTLSQFKKESKPKIVENKQKEKLLEIEKKLEEQKEKDKQQVEDDRMSKIEKRKELEAAQKALTRKKALMQYAETKVKHYGLLSKYIMTNTQPSLFFLPAKHNMRSMELLRNTEKKIQGLIILREKELEKDLEAPAHHHVDDEEETLKSIVSKPGSRRDRERHGRNGEAKKEEKPDIKQATPKAEQESEGEDDEGYEPDVVPPEHRIVIE